MTNKLYTIPTDDRQREFNHDPKGVIVPASNKEQAWTRALTYHNGHVSGSYGVKKIHLAKSKIHESTASEIINSPIHNKNHRNYLVNMSKWPGDL